MRLCFVDHECLVGMSKDVQTKTTGVFFSYCTCAVPTLETSYSSSQGKLGKVSFYHENWDRSEEGWQLHTATSCGSCSAMTVAAGSGQILICPSDASSVILHNSEVPDI